MLKLAVAKRNSDIVNQHLLFQGQYISGVATLVGNNAADINVTGSSGIDHLRTAERIS